LTEKKSRYKIHNLAPEPSLPDIIYTLFNTDNLWYPGANHQKLIESIVVKSLFVRRNTGQPVNPQDRRNVDRFSVFFAMIRLNLGHQKQPIPPPKGRHQLWTDSYTDAVIWYWHSCINSSFSRKNKIAYTINPNLTLDDLCRFKKQAQNL
jgi:hypothetical protein